MVSRSWWLLSVDDARPVSESDYEKFRKLVEETFQRFCTIEGVNFEAEYRKSIWLNPMNSGNYVKAWEA